MNAEAGRPVAYKARHTTTAIKQGELSQKALHTILLALILVLLTLATLFMPVAMMPGAAPYYTALMGTLMIVTTVWLLR